jgi:hypothetical protein
MLTPLNPPPGCLQLVVDTSKLQGELQTQKHELDKVTAANIELEMQRVQAQVRLGTSLQSACSHACSSTLSETVAAELFLLDFRSMNSWLHHLEQL